MFNYEVKKAYLYNEISDSHRVALGKIFSKSIELESFLNKDIYDFSHSELEQFFNSVSPKTIRQGRDYFNSLREYIDWCICQGYKKSNVNTLNTVESKWIDRFVV